MMVAARAWGRRVDELRNEMWWTGRIVWLQAHHTARTQLIRGQRVRAHDPRSCAWPKAARSAFIEGGGSQINSAGPELVTALRAKWPPAHLEWTGVHSGPPRRGAGGERISTEQFSGRELPNGYDEVVVLTGQ
ncbi:hypothetical protein GCM10018952_00410 [Streptosporangium vulgare]